MTDKISNGKDLKKKNKRKKPDKGWCSYCKRHNIVEQEKLDLKCEDCFMCRNCNHPRAWHDNQYQECHADEDTCNCGGFK